MLQKLWNGFWNTRTRVHRAIEQVNEVVVIFFVIGLFVVAWTMN